MRRFAYRGRGHFIFPAAFAAAELCVGGRLDCEFGSAGAVELDSANFLRWSTHIDAPQSLVVLLDHGCLPMRSLRRHEGYLLIDHRESPGTGIRKALGVVR